MTTKSDKSDGATLPAMGPRLLEETYSHGIHTGEGPSLINHNDESPRLRGEESPDWWWRNFLRDSRIAKESVSAGSPLLILMRESFRSAMS